MSLRTFTVTDDDRVHLIAIDALLELLLKALSTVMQTLPDFPRDASRIEDFVLGENQLFAFALDKWVLEFADSGFEMGNSPELHPEPHVFYLIQRVKCARLNVDDLLDQKEPRMILPATRPAVPHPSQYAAFYRWLLLDEWERLGESYLKEFTRQWLTLFGALAPYQLSAAQR